ncbi:amino acid ABC transporter permease [Citricoccus sp. K5]|uniref:amino acid ABC transporter permease n=1 Tax=Citricoccus sp. K5 TaxID=2653135 RepID=UPI0012F183C9|nr:amino acid ABC transporter permease [Citricoccus sp. K5]VXC06583.1 putative amino-acid ABC transporter permease protein y4tF [Citricoccus sp. K5]
MLDNLHATAEAWPLLAQGLWVTIQLTVMGSALSLVLAVVLGLMAGASNKALAIPGRIIIEFFRGTSLVVQLFFIFFVLPQLGVELPGMVVGVLALGLNYGAYSAEVVRGSIASVPRGQWEATTALSMSPVHRMRRVIFPQAWALMIPSLASLMVHLLKGTAIVSVILLRDFTFYLDQLTRQTDTFWAYAAVGLVGYFLLALILTLFMNALEARAKHRLGRGPSLREVLSPTPTNKNSLSTAGGGV